MAIILSKIFAGIMSVVITLSGMFPALFGGKEFIDPNSDKVSIVSSFVYNDVDKAEVITDYEKFNSLLGVKENGEFNKSFFEEFNLVVIPVAIPNSACEVFVESVIVKNDKVTVNYSVVRDSCFGATVISTEIIFIAVDKDVEDVISFKKNVIVPFCIHKD